MINRDCFWQYLEDECFYSKLLLDFQVDSCETCDTDGCNGVNHNSATELAAILGSSNGLIVVAVFFSYLYGKMGGLSKFGTFQWTQTLSHVCLFIKTQAIIVNISAIKCI